MQARAFFSLLDLTRPQVSSFGAIGAAIWGAFCYQKLAMRGSAWTANVPV